MVKLGMAILGKGDVGSRGAINGTAFLDLLFFLAPRDLVISMEYLGEYIKNWDGGGKLITITLLITPIHITMFWVKHGFKA